MRTTTTGQTRTDLPVTGMTCRSCEARVERGVGRIPGVVEAHASATSGRLSVIWAGDPDRAAIAAAVAKAGYTVGRPQWLSRDRAVWITLAASVAVVAVIAVVAQAAGWSRLSAGVGSLEAGGLAVVLLLGLAAGVSSCMVLTGGLILALSASYTARLEREGIAATRGQAWRPLLVFNAGRIVGFALLGALLGLVGSGIMLPGPVMAVLTIAVALVMAVLGIRLTDVSPRIAGWSPTLPAGVGRWMGLDARAGRGYSDTRTALLGAATFFLPCGFTQAVQLYALASGNPAYAALAMGTFALGTAPGLLTFGGLPHLLSGDARTRLLRGLGVLVLLFAAMNATAGLRLLGIDAAHPLGSPDAGATTVTSNVTVTSAEQVLRTQQVTDGYLPVRSVVYAGLPISWVIESYDSQSCAVYLRAPAVGVATRLQPGSNTIDLPAQEPGSITFSCSMGMYGGTITVIPRTT